jgi:hypothetical protein
MDTATATSESTVFPMIQQTDYGILRLEDGKLTITHEGEGAAFWESPAEWYVDSYAFGDAVGDGTQQLTMSVWKAGNFGPSQPFWVTENDPSVKNHFFVFTFTDKTLEPVWQSSNLEKPNCD